MSTLSGELPINNASSTLDRLTKTAKWMVNPNVDVIFLFLYSMRLINFQDENVGRILDYLDDNDLACTLVNRIDLSVKTYDKVACHDRQ